MTIRASRFAPTCLAIFAGSIHFGRRSGWMK